jgi:hypothetical protein
MEPAVIRPAFKNERLVIWFDMDPRKVGLKKLHAFRQAAGKTRHPAIRGGFPAKTCHGGTACYQPLG